MKLARLFRTFNLKRKGGGIMTWIFNLFLEKTTYAQLLPVFTLIFLAAHIVACIWHFFSFQDNSPNTWISRNGYRGTPNSVRYIASLYFVFQTVKNISENFLKIF